ncbi:type VI secretion system-associated FHA domain protein TagH [Halomonas aquamarina]|uniref:Type VI secretion system-associated FHA domain protein TagH n=1 Tax=Vreelandella aquamarina TaxID=77097 RepID=A0ACC5VWY4_9GAMM|nr:type VI secretion system-associated FHA domain protein TagH [Halomonas aquamarina]MBZ5488716.1 type VI secretion system-associated FHA domain protein TagH [Halomonas aquamarina]
MQVDPFDAVTLVVVNSEQLEGRSSSSYVFQGEGGTLGSSDYDDWLLQDHAGRVRPQHAEITKIDGKFCLIDCSGHTFINRATLPVGRNRKVALRDGDELTIGVYRMKVHTGDRHAWQPGVHSLTTLIDEEHDDVTAYEHAVWPMGSEPAERHQTQQDDPIEALGGVVPGSLQHDPMIALDKDAAPPATLEPLDASPSAYRSHTNEWRQQEQRDEAVRLPDIKPLNGITKQRSSGMDERQLNDLERSVGEQLEDRWQQPTTQALSHVGADPLLRGLGLDLPFQNSEEQQAFLEEAGQTLRATIDGLRRLQQSQNDSKYPLRDRRLQPIEDNPLRLGLAFEETAETMFSAQRSPVHLSAPEAVAESLRHQGQHQAAVEEAIGQALGAILDAFSPEALLKRFHAYRGAGNRIEDEGGWAWEMYQHYYRELNSGRQQGFQKLFWEVFEQGYDQSVRRQQREEA